MTLSYSATPRSNEADVRDRIFNSALRHFSSKGYAATSLREIADDAQTTKPMIYYYFGSKEGLYSSIVRQILEDMAAWIRNEMTADIPPGDQVIRYCERYLQYFMAQEEIIALVLREVFGLGGPPMATFAETLGAEVRRPLDDILEAGMQNGDFHEDNVKCCAAAISGILNQFILAHVFGGADFESEAPIHQVRYYVRGLSRIS